MNAWLKASICSRAVLYITRCEKSHIKYSRCWIERERPHSNAIQFTWRLRPFFCCSHKCPSRTIECVDSISIRQINYRQYFFANSLVYCSASDWGIGIGNIFKRIKWNATNSTPQGQCCTKCSHLNPIRFLKVHLKWKIVGTKKKKKNRTLGAT